MELLNHKAKQYAARAYIQEVNPTPSFLNPHLNPLKSASIKCTLKIPVPPPPPCKWLPSEPFLSYSTDSVCLCVAVDYLLSGFQSVHITFFTSSVRRDKYILPRL